MAAFSSLRNPDASAAFSLPNVPSLPSGELPSLHLSLPSPFGAADPGAKAERAAAKSDSDARTARMYAVRKERMAMESKLRSDDYAQRQATLGASGSFGSTSMPLTPAVQESEQVPPLAPPAERTAPAGEGEGNMEGNV